MAKIDKPLIKISELKEKENTSDTIFCGVCSMQGWKPGKMVTEEEYVNVVKGFLNKPMGGKAVKNA